jgi:hypothetical protein
MILLEASTIVRNAYREVLGRQPDDGGLKHYSAMLINNQITEKRLYEVLKDSDEYKQNNKRLVLNNTWPFDGPITYIQCTHSGDIQDAIKNVKVCKVVDFRINCVLIVDETVIQEDIIKAQIGGALVFEYPWNDNLPEQRNHALDAARQYHSEWVFSSDPDEHFSYSFFKEIRCIISQAKNEDYDLIQINCHNYNDDIKQDNPKNYYKDLLFRLTPEVHFEGHGNLKIWHEGIVGLHKSIKLESRFYYTHIFSKNTLLEHWTRDFFICGGGPSLGNENPTWMEFKVIIAQDFNGWQDYNNYLKSGNIDDDIKKFMIKHKDDNQKDGDQQVRAMFKYYFEYLHPEENVNHLTNLDVFGDLQ